MQKTLDILEKNVQWFVLGLAALFLLWVAYAYVITPPATIKMGTQEATPSNVSLLVKNSADRLEDQIKNAGAPTFPTPDLVSNWKEHMDQPFAEEFALAGRWPDSVPGLNGPLIGGFAATKIKPLDALPTPPAAILLPPVVGLSTVSLLPPNAPNNPAPAPAGQPVAQQTKDTDWIMIPGGISGPALAQALLAPLKGQQDRDPTIAQIYNTTLLQVVLERQAVDVNGNPIAGAPIEQVPPLTIYQPLIKPLPPASEGPNAGFQYVAWAQAHQDLIGGPTMNQVVAGDPWTVPQLPQGGVTAPVAPPVAPATTTPPPITTPPATTTPPETPRTNTPPPPPANNTQPPSNQRPNQSSPPMNSPRSTAMPRSGGGRHYVPADPARPDGMLLALGDPGSFNPGGLPFNNGNFPGADNGGGAGNPAGGPGVLNPFQISSDVLIWAIDETATPGQTYRYRITYKLKNPIYSISNMGAPKLIDQLAINSPPSAWTAPIKAPEMTKFWLVDASVSKGSAKVDIFHYQKGSWLTSKGVDARPGDQIPGRDLTVVDVRQGDRREKYVLLASDTGEIQRRDVATDAADPDHQSMLAPPNPNGGGRGGPPVPGPGPVGLGR